jgi:hypothetical protein
MPTVIRDGVRLHYSDAGDGPPVFFHTGGGGDGTMWNTAGYLVPCPAGVIFCTTTEVMDEVTNPRVWKHIASMSTSQT